MCEREGSRHSGRPLVVVGAGAGGLGTAISAARLGLEVILVERLRDIGGSFTHCLLSTLCGLYDDAGRIINEGITEELCERLGESSPDVRRRRLGRTWILETPSESYAKVIGGWIAEISGIEVITEARIKEVDTDAPHVESVSLMTPKGEREIHLSALVDATGSAAIVEAVHPRLVIGSVGTAGGWIVRLPNVEHDIHFPMSAAIAHEAHQAADAGQLPELFRHLQLEATSKEIIIKVTVDSPDESPAPPRDELMASLDALLSFIQKSCGIDLPEEVRVGYIGARENGTARCEYRLTLDDVLQGREVWDRACRSAWPVEHWSIETGVTLKHLPRGSSYDIPLRALKVRGFNNLWVAGRCLSAEPLAQSSARVTGPCWAMGEAIAHEIALGKFGWSHDQPI